MRDRGVKWQLTLSKFFNKNKITKKIINLNPEDILMTQHEGIGVTDDLWAAVERTSIDIIYSTPACGSQSAIQSGVFELSSVTAHLNLPEMLFWHAVVLKHLRGFDANFLMRDGTSLLSARRTSIREPCLKRPSMQVLNQPGTEVGVMLLPRTFTPCELAILQ